MLSDIKNDIKGLNPNKVTKHNNIPPKLLRQSESEDSDDITITDTSTDNNTEPGYTYRICQQNDNLKQVNKTKNKNTERVNRGNDIPVRNLKQKPQDYINFSHQNQNPHQKTKDFREPKKKSNSILILPTAC